MDSEGGEMKEEEENKEVELKLNKNIITNLLK